MDPEKGQAKVPLTFKEELTANTSGFIHDPLFTKLKKLTPIILLIALLLFFISYGSPYWAESTSAARRAEHLGLWRFCSEDNYSGKENCDDFINYNYNGENIVIFQAILQGFPPSPENGLPFDLNNKRFARLVQAKTSS